MGVLTVSASANSMATAGPSLSGSLELFTNDPQNAHASVALGGTATGPVLAFQPTEAKSFAFPATEVNVPASLISLTLVNSGNAPGTFTIASPSDSHFDFEPAPDAGQQTINLAPGATFTLSAGFTPTNTSPLTAS